MNKQQECMLASLLLSNTELFDFYGFVQDKKMHYGGLEDMYSFGLDRYDDYKGNESFNQLNLHLPHEGIVFDEGCLPTRGDEKGFSYTSHFDWCIFNT